MKLYFQTPKSINRASFWKAESSSTSQELGRGLLMAVYCVLFTQPQLDLPTSEGRSPNTGPACGMFVRTATTPYN